MVVIHVNGEMRRYQAQDAPKTLAALVESLGLDLSKIAIERNRQVIPRSTLNQTTLADGDVVEIIHFVGGG